MDRRASGQKKNYFVSLVTSVCVEDQGIWYMFSRTVKCFVPLLC
jgi:hypothetical protein